MTAQGTGRAPGGWKEGTGKEKLRIRSLGREDSGNVAALEREIFGTPWSEETVEDSITRSLAGRSGAVYGAFGAFLPSVEGIARAEVLAGYLFAVSAAGEGELHRIAAAPAFRRKGVGDALMRTLFSWFSGRGEGGIWLEVRAGNEAAVSLYKKHGFLETGRRKNYYQNPTEDALIFVYH